ncbi:MAG TPA: hypothetical protein DCS97_03520 [Planctomycetes bacterium]|nr:hypothetical protein [Planctomycetota bacterium]
MQNRDLIRIGNVHSDLAFLNTGQPFIPCYLANGWIGGCCDEFGFHSRPQYDMDHGRTGFGHQMHYVRRPWGGHDLVQLLHLKAAHADGRMLGLAGLGAYDQELDLATASLRTAWAIRGTRHEVRAFASWAVPQLHEWRLDQQVEAAGDLLALELVLDTSPAENNARRKAELLPPPHISIDVLAGDLLRVTTSTGCRTTQFLLHGDGLRFAPDSDRIRIITRSGVSRLRLLMIEPQLAREIAADPAGWLASVDAWTEHVAAVERRWSSGLVLLPDGPPAQVWLRSRYYAIASLPPYPCHIQDPTGLCANIWGHGFAQDQYYVVEALPRLGLADLARTQMPVWRDHLAQVLRYTRRLADVDGAFYPWIPPFEEWDGFEVDGPRNADSFEFHNSVYVAAMAIGLHRYGGEAAELAGHLPMLREIARFYAAITVLPTTGRARIAHPRIRSQDEAMPAGHSTEHPLCCVWSALYAMRAWLTARENLAVDDDPELAATVGAILARGYDLDALRRPAGGLTTCANDPRPPGQQKHPVQLNAIALLPMADLMDDPDVQHAWRHRLDLCRSAREPRSYGWTFALFALASARMRSGEALAADLALVQPARYADGRWIQFYESSCRHGWQHKKPYYFTTSGLYLQALTDAVVQDCRGIIDLCAALLPEWRGRRIEVHGVTSLAGARVDGWYEAGACHFTITPQCDGPLRLRLGLSGPCLIAGEVAMGGEMRLVEGRAGMAVVVQC